MNTLDGDLPELNPAELSFTTFKPPGSGGFSMGRIDPGVRITHLPSGIMAESWDDRSQHKNKATALVELRRKVAQWKPVDLSHPELQKEVDLFLGAVGKLSQDLKYIRAAVIDYYDAMIRREHGGVAESKAMNKIEEILGLHFDTYRNQKLSESKEK